MMNAEQKAAFLAARCGKLTASNMNRAMSFLKNGEPSKERIKLLFELVAERVTGDNVRHYVTDEMQWGIDHEDEAADRFVELTGRDLHVSHTYDHPSIEGFAATPDRELEDGLVEIKCPRTETFVQWKLNGVVPQEHRNQMLAQLACTKKKWVGFVAFDPRIKEERHQLFLARFEPEPYEIEMVEDAARAFLEELDALFDKFVLGDAV